MRANAGASKGTESRRFRGVSKGAARRAEGRSALSACSPSITNLSPSAGAPGDKVLITGGRLTVGGSNPAKVDFNGTAAPFKAVGNAVQATVPTGATSGPVHVKTNYVDSNSPGGTATSPYAFTVVQGTFSETEKA